MLKCLTHDNPFIQVELNESILTIKIDRPDIKNALNADMYSFIAEILDEADHSNLVNVVILQGNQQDFTAGNDMKFFMSAAQSFIDLAPDATPPFVFLKSIARFSKPLIAAVRGCTIGVGVTLLFHCDMVYAHPDTEFQIPFVSLGLSVEGGTSMLFTELAGYHMAAELLLTGRKFTATEALQTRIINQISEQPEQLAFERAQQIAAMPLNTLKIIKSQIRPPQTQIQNCISQEAEVVATRLKSPEMIEAVMAFLQKRKPDFKQFS
jgi:enoyl-CoA hydratase/carnithine racemase